MKLVPVYSGVNCCGVVTLCIEIWGSTRQKWPAWGGMRARCRKKCVSAVPICPLSQNATDWFMWLFWSTQTTSALGLLLLLLLLNCSKLWEFAIHNVAENRGESNTFYANYQSSNIVTLSSAGCYFFKLPSTRLLGGQMYDPCVCIRGQTVSVCSLFEYFLLQKRKWQFKGNHDFLKRPTEQL